MSSLTSESERLKQMLLKDALQYNPEGYVLRSGQRTNHIWRCNRVVMDPVGSILIGKLFWDAIKDDPPDSVGGPETGAILLALAIARESNNRVRAFYVNKKPAPEPLDPWISGNFSTGDTSDFCDDVVTTGKSIDEVCLKRMGGRARFGRILCIIDRRENPDDQKLFGLDLISLYKDKELLNS